MPTKVNSTKLYTIIEAAEELGMHKNSLRKRIYKGTLKPLFIRNTYFLTQKQIDEIRADREERARRAEQRKNNTL